MPFFEWTSALDLSDERINAQHREIVARINALYAALHNQTAGQDPRDLLTFLVNYVGEHFEFEERIMREAKFPRMSDHQGEHQALRDEVAKLAQRFIMTADVDNEELLRFLKRWLVQHILGWDLQLARHLASQEPQAPAAEVR